LIQALLIGKRSRNKFCIILTRSHLNRLRAGSDLTQRKPAGVKQTSWSFQQLNAKPWKPDGLACQLEATWCSRWQLKHSCHELKWCSQFRLDHASRNSCKCEKFNYIPFTDNNKQFAFEFTNYFPIYYLLFNYASRMVSWILLWSRIVHNMHWQTRFRSYLMVKV
jgi:hypothetical protein